MAGNEPAFLRPEPTDQTRETILQGLSDRGVLFDLIDGVFRYCDPHGVLSPREEDAIDVVRPGLSEYLRPQRGFCIECGSRCAILPDFRGVRVNRSEEARSTFVNLSYGSPQWVDPPVWRDLGEEQPPRWCRACWLAILKKGSSIP